MKRIERILVPVDLCRDQRALVDYGISFAKQCDAELRFFTVIDSPTQLCLIENPPVASPPVSEPGFLAKMVADAEILLRRMVERAGGRGVRASGHVVVSEKVGDEVVAEACKRGTDIIVIGSEDRSMLTRILIGGSQDAILHRAPCPVLTVKIDGMTEGYGS